MENKSGKDQIMPPKLDKVFTLRGYLDKTGTIDAGPLKGDNGPRQIVVPIPSGYLEGSGIRGELLPGSGDWQTVSTYSILPQPAHQEPSALELGRFSRQY